MDHSQNFSPQGRKGKTQKHTAAETASKHAAAKAKSGGAGGGGDGKAAREAKKASGSIKVRSYYMITTCDHKMLIKLPVSQAVLKSAFAIANALHIDFRIMTDSF